MPRRPDRPSRPPGGVRTDHRPADFPDRVTIAGLEGGSIATADRDGRWFLVFEDSGLGLDAEELEALRHRLGRVEEFPSATARDAYVQARFGASLLREPRRRRR